LQARTSSQQWVRCACAQASTPRCVATWLACPDTPRASNVSTAAGCIARAAAPTSCATTASGQRSCIPSCAPRTTSLQTQPGARLRSRQAARLQLGYVQHGDARRGHAKHGAGCRQLARTHCAQPCRIACVCAKASDALCWGACVRAMPEGLARATPLDRHSTCTAAPYAARAATAGAKNLCAATAASAPAGDGAHARRVHGLVIGVCDHEEHGSAWRDAQHCRTCRAEAHGVRPIRHARSRLLCQAGVLRARAPDAALRAFRAAAVSSSHAENAAQHTSAAAAAAHMPPTQREPAWTCARTARCSSRRGEEQHGTAQGARRARVQ
jgi:hypothetical protein